MAQPVTQTLSQKLGKPILFHLVVWHGKDGIAKSIPGYDSRDLNVIASQLACMRAVGGEGTGVIILTFGPTVSPFIHQACMNVCNQCQALGMPFALCFDPWTVKNPDGSMPTQAVCNSRMIAALQHPDIVMMMSASCYLPGKPVFDFSTGADRAAVLAAVPGINYWLEQVDYDWPQIPEQKNRTLLPCVYGMFDDGTGQDRNKSCWDQKQPMRLIPSRAGRTLWTRTGLTVGNYIQYASWNDYNEQTQCESRYSEATGIVI